MEKQNYSIASTHEVNRVITLFILAAALLAASISVFIGLDDPRVLVGLAWVGNGVFAYGIVYFWKSKATVINQFSLLWSAIFIFSYGQIFLYSLGLTYKRFNLFQIYSMELINQYILYFIFSMLFFLFSSTFFLQKKEPVIIEQTDSITRVNSTKIVAFSLFALSAPAFIQQKMATYRVTSSMGYGGIYASSNEGSGLAYLLSLWFIPAVFLLFYMFRKELLKKNLLILTLFATVCFSFYVGDRGSGTSVLLGTIFLLLTTASEKDRKAYTIFAVAIIGILFFVYPLIASVRGAANRTLDDYLKAYIDAGGPLQLAINTFGELGSSMQIWLRLQSIVPEVQNYSFGFSYVASVLSCIPSFFFGGFSFANYAILSRWITQIEHESYGLGFSMLGETYYNFGWFGIIAIYFVGLFIFWVLSGSWIKRYQDLRIPFIAIALYIFAFIGRSSIYLNIRHCLYLLLFPYLAIVILTQWLEGSELERRWHSKEKDHQEGMSQ
ncbi:O-antigen polysaccharide polymerase Wzy [Enterococcus sp. AZ109]|uniref:O-antigen polysaccharide polymerase Wzy n=1 Tax=Enterococcus sp. AZ109 TaxID=2774634 RepID=UPI003F29986C